MSVTTPSITYKIDPMHSAVRFSVRHLMISRVHGQFSGVAGTVEIPNGSHVPTAIDVTIDVASIDTREAQRDTHLRSPDFFHVEQHPNMTFRSTQITGTDEAFTVEGILTIRGASQPVTLDASFGGGGTDAWGGYRLGYEAQAKINRSAFGLSYNQVIEGGGVVIGDEIKIELNLELVRS